jgi:homoserine kinase type II
LNQSLTRGVWPELESRAARILQLAPSAAGSVLSILSRASRAAVPLQVCIGDIWHDHVLYVGDRISGFVDFGSMRTDNVAADLARLLGSLAQDNPHMWQVGLEAYESIRPLGSSERPLVEAFDRSTVLMSGLNWIDWIFRQRRTFEAADAIPGRLDDIVSRLEHLSQTASPEW